MKLSLNKITQNPFSTSEQLNAASNNLFQFFEKQIISINDFYYLWNKSSSIFLSYICEIISSFNKIKYENTEIFAIHLLFLMEGIINYFPSRKSISFRIKKILFQSLTDKEKITFLKSFTFSRPFYLPQNNLIKTSHIFCINKVYCSSQCEVPPNQNINNLLSQLLDKIYQIRSSAVHCGLTPNFLLNISKSPARYYARIYDKFALKEKQKFILFSSSLTKADFEFFIKKSLWNHLNKNI